MTRADRYLTAGILGISLLAAMMILFLRFSVSRSGVNSTQAVIKAQGRTVRTISLSADVKSTAFIVNGRIGPATIELEGRRIRIAQAPCHDKICVRQGWIEKPGETIICIPNEIIINIKGVDPLDAVTR
jgi:hypothetical protein